jgi:hypothetical protein
MSLGAGQGWAYWHYVRCSGPTLGMSRGGNGVSAHAGEGTFHGTRESCGTCPAARTNTGHVPLRAKIPLGMSLGAGQGWAYWHCVHCSGPTLGMSRLGDGVSAPSQEGTFHGTRESCGTCPAAQTKNGHVPWRRPHRLPAPPTRAHARRPAPSAALSRTSINLRGRIDSRATGQAWARSALV